MQSNKFKSFVLFSLAVFKICVLSCEEQPLLEFDEKTFYREWTAWEAQGIKDYSVKVKCEQHSPTISYFSYQVIVKDSKIIKLESSYGYDYGTFGKYTIPGLYLWTKYLVEANENVCGSIKIIYNKDFHYPEVIDIYLPRKAYSPVVLGSGAVYLSEFTPLTPATEE